MSLIYLLFVRKPQRVAFALLAMIDLAIIFTILFTLIALKIQSAVS